MGTTLASIEMESRCTTMGYIPEGAFANASGMCCMRKVVAGQKVICHCDNMAVVEVMNNGYSRDRLLMHLIRCLFFISEHFKVQVEAVHCPGKDNIRADALS